ncbi:polysaccharide pyruvyl transferase family protein [Microbacterium sp. CFBP9034]|uniref:polysaccharide pyruvyl transferase family protein n=1 Tax=Microbacterium sp. CFBP9034 TaxID=3096540 RepID=UPI002A6B1E67|nr:polysaccharide pyruvyl transferase family protein [Microbacterium sp. CFBP9034]MDY0910386.1 polysaccharide pyruvyl transferase family protein [Microbacterium sp. CFBP9034]
MSSSIVTRVRWAWRSLVIRSGIPAARDRAAFARAFPGAAAADTHVLLVAPGAGNVGDQALFESFVEGTTGHISVVARRIDDVAIPPAHADRITVITMPELVYGMGGAHRREVAELARLLARAFDFSIVGADIMDGRYVLRASVNRSVVAGAAAEAGIPTRILGFSWNGSARPPARRALVAASRSGAVPLLRDPVSLRRAENDGVTGAVLVADIVFTAASVDPTWAEEYATSAPLAIVNVSGLISDGVDQTAEYAEIIDQLRDGGYEVLLLPHVSRSSADDVVACQAVRERVGPERVRMASTLPTPAQVRGLTAIADVVVTGRMHLAIMSLWNGTPAITLATQGKVEGLMELMSAPELCVAPEPGFGAVVVSALRAILPAGSPTRAAIGAALPRVIELAQGNLNGLARPEEGLSGPLPASAGAAARGLPLL